MKLIIIAAIARNRVIGSNGKLPWHIPEDLARFKKLTTGHTVLMGRRTYESLGKPLPNRRNVVLSSKPILNAKTYTSLTSALEELKDEEQVFIIGGGRLFNETLKIADELHLTIIHKSYDGDVFFPVYEEFVEKNFRIVKEERFEGFSFLDYKRKKRLAGRELYSRPNLF